MLLRYVLASTELSSGWLRYFSKRDRMMRLSPRGIVIPAIVTVSSPGLKRGISSPKGDLVLGCCRLTVVLVSVGVVLGFLSGEGGV